MFPLAMSDATIIGLATLFFGFLTAVFTGLLQVYMAKMAHQQKLDAANIKVVAEKTEVVATTLEATNTAHDERANKQDEKIDSLIITAEETHKWVNSERGAQLRMTAEDRRRISDLLPENDADRQAAEQAEMLLQAHVTQQTKMDAAAAVAV